MSNSVSEAVGEDQRSNSRTKQVSNAFATRFFAVRIAVSYLYYPTKLSNSMLPLFKAIRLSFRYKWTIFASVISALCVGVLWGASITTVYPLVNVIFKGDTIESWLDKEAEKADQNAIELEQEIETLEQQLDESASLQSLLSTKQSRYEAEKKAVAYYKSLQPWIAGWVPKTPFNTLVLVMVLLVVATSLKGFFLVSNVRLVNRIVQCTTMDMRRMFYRSTLEMDNETIDSEGTTGLMTNLSHNLGLITGGLQTLYGKSIREPLKMLTCLIGAAYICWQLLVLSLIAIPLGAFLIHYLSKKMRRAARDEATGINAIFQALIETLDGIEVVKIFNRERRERHRFKKIAQTLYNKSMRISFYDSLLKPITELTGIISIAIAILAGAYLVLNQETHMLGIRICDRPLSASALFVFYGLLVGACDPARKMGDAYNILFRANWSAKRLFTKFEKEPKVVASDCPQAVPLHTQSIRFDTVVFSYNAKKRVLHKINLEISFGQTVALIGPNGCGKTTLSNLIPRFYDPNKGDVFLDDVNLRDVNPKKLRRQIALVNQKPTLFSGTVWSNIIYSAPNSSKEEVLAAARLARVEDFIDQLPEGYDTSVGDHGKFLSGGQCQRIAMARAILANPRILILDEATSQIDCDTERLAHESLRKFFKSRTTIIVTHRQMTAELADRVIVMRHGKIISDLLIDEYLNHSKKSKQKLGPNRKAA